MPSGATPFECWATVKRFRGADANGICGDAASPPADTDYNTYCSRVFSSSLCDPYDGIWLNSNLLELTITGTPVFDTLSNPQFAVWDPPFDTWYIRCRTNFTGGSTGGNWISDTPNTGTIVDPHFLVPSPNVAYCGSEQTPFLGSDGYWSCWCCPGGYTWDPNSRWCLTEPCPDGQRWCEASQSCVDVTVPQCSDALNCVWNPETCSWDCDDPDCSPGYVWNTQVCECIPECPTGLQWCETSGQCVEAADPACKDVLNCEWDPIGCEWICDDPNVKCGSRTWNATECACTGGEAPDNLHDRRNRYHVAYAGADGIRYRRSDYYVPPFALDVDATDDSADQTPAIAEDWRHRLWLLLERRGDVYQCYSDDDGATWSEPELVFEDATVPRNLVDPATGAFYRAARTSSGTITATIQYPGDLTPSAAFTVQVDDGAGNLVDLVIDDAGFSLSVARDGSRRWLLTAMQSGTQVDFESWDDGATFRQI